MKEYVTLKDVDFRDNRIYWLKGHKINWIRLPGKGAYDHPQYCKVYYGDDFFLGYFTEYTLCVAETLPDKQELKIRILEIIENELFYEYVCLAHSYPELNPVDKDNVD